MVQRSARGPRRRHVRRRAPVLSARGALAHTHRDARPRCRDSNCGTCRRDERTLRPRQSNVDRRAGPAYSRRIARSTRLSTAVGRRGGDAIGHARAAAPRFGRDRRTRARRRKLHLACDCARRRVRRGARSSRESSHGHAAGRYGISLAGAANAASSDDSRARRAVRFLQRARAAAHRQSDSFLARAADLSLRGSVAVYPAVEVVAAPNLLAAIAGALLVLGGAVALIQRPATTARTFLRTMLPSESSMPLGGST